MGYPVREYVEDYWYHIYTRGQRGEPLFFAPEDRIQYLKLLDGELNRRGGNIGSFCLMTNHVHLMLRMGETSLGEILQYAHSKYARDFNARRKTRGHVTQGRPGVKVVLDDSYLWSLVGYIHCNPLEAKVTEEIEDYRWSSWYWFKNETCGWIELKTWRYPPGFEGNKREIKFHQATGRTEGAEWPGGRKYIGTEEQWEDFEERRQSGREKQAYRERRERRELEELAREMTEGSKYTVDKLKGPSRNRDVSGVRHNLMAKMYKEGHRQADIARYFNRTPRTVRKAIQKHQE